MRLLCRSCAVLLLAWPACARALPPEMDRHLQGALDSLYCMQFSSAEAQVKLAMAVEPEHPYGPFGLAAVSMIKYVYGTEQSDPALLAAFTKQTEEALDAGTAWVKKHPQDAEGFMALGAAYGVSSRLLTVRRQWILAYWRARKAVGYLQKATQLDPEMGDPYLGLGMYDYYSDAYPRFVRVLAKLLLRGNRARGVAELRRSSEKGSFSQIVSKMILTEIFLEDQWGLRNPQEAVKLSAEVRQRYPDSAMILDIDFVARYEAGEYEALLPDLEQFLERARQGRYDSLQLAKGLVIKATTLWAWQKPEEALKTFADAAAVKPEGKVSRWGVWAQIRAGNLLDSLGRREEAVALYKAAAAEPDLWDLRQFAKAGLHEAFQQPSPGHISPFGA